MPPPWRSVCSTIGCWRGKARRSRHCRPAKPTKIADRPLPPQLRSLANLPGALEGRCIARQNALSYAQSVFSNPYTSNRRRAFADQFEADGTGFLYRKYMKGPAIRVTEAERDEFISAFQRRLRYAVWATVPAMLLLIGALVLLVPDADSPESDTVIWAGLIAIVIPFLAASFWAWNAPARELARRTPAGEARTREEVEQIAFSQMTYGRLASAFGLALVLLWNALNRHDVLHGWDILWLGCSAALMIGVAIQVFRKWTYEHR